MHAAACSGSTYPIYHTIPTPGCPYREGIFEMSVKILPVNAGSRVLFLVFGGLLVAPAEQATTVMSSARTNNHTKSPAPINHTVSQIFQHGEGPCTCIGVPALIHTRNLTVLAFAECRIWVGDGCWPKVPAPKPPPTVCNGTCVVLKRSSDGGRTWSLLYIVTNAGGNVMPVWDAVRGRVVLNFALPAVDEVHAIISTIASTDSAQILSVASWSAPRQIARYPNGWASAPGPAPGVQLRAGSVHAGRLVFSGYLHNNGLTCDVRHYACPASVHLTLFYQFLYPAPACNMYCHTLYMTRYMHIAN